MTERIRWESNGYAGFLGYVGTMHDSDWLFQIWEANAGAGKWRLSSSLPGQSEWQMHRDDPAELKAEAERWLEEFVSSLGAIFPDALRKAVQDERGHHLELAGEAQGDCPHAWRPDVSCGMARSLDWVLSVIDETGASQ